MTSARRIARRLLVLVGVAVTLWGTPTHAQAPFAFDIQTRERMQARLLERNGRVAEAMAAYQRLLAEHPEDHDIRDEYLDALIRHERHDHAEALLRDWMRREPESPTAARRMAELYMAQGRSAQAAHAYETALRLAERRGDPPDLYALEGLAYAYWDLGKERDALQRFRELETLQPDNMEVREHIRVLCRERRTKYVSPWAPRSRRLCP